MENEVKKKCPHCMMEVDPKATKCPHCQSKISKGINVPGILVVLALFSVIPMIGVVMGSSSSSTSTSAPSIPFSTQARANLNQVLKASPELAGIECQNGDCGNVVYFDYKTVPEDVEFVIRANAASLSKFKQDKTGVSHVTIAARKNGDVFFACNAAKGIVTGCDSY